MKQTEQNASFADQKEVGPTNERMMQAFKNGVELNEFSIRDASGFETGVKYRKIDSPFERALRKRWIEPREYMAGLKFSECVYVSYGQTSITGRFEFSVDGSRVTSSISDKILSAQDSVRSAMNSIDQKYRAVFFDWVQRSLSSDIDVYHFGMAFSKAKRRDKVVDVGKYHLSIVLSGLARHYGF